MTALRRLLLVLLIWLVPTLALTVETGTVVEVVDGDTIKVELGGRIEKIRLIGVDTPETVHPQKPVEYFGKEASAFTRRVALGQIVRLEDDRQDQNRDKYGRLLRYVFLPDGTLLNAEIIAQGYGHAYTRFPFTRMEEFRVLERDAREANRGLWGGGELTSPAAAIVTSASAPLAADGSETVYVTRTGTKYHRLRCRYLAKSSIPSALKDAASRYGPCSVCTPPSLQATGAARTPSPATQRAAPPPTPQAAVDPPAAAIDEQTVYVTRTGTKYHRAGCRSLAKSQIPLPLKEAAPRYSPCSLCVPPRPGAPGAAATESAPTATSPAPASSGGGRCQAITKAGTQCKRNAAAGSTYC